MYTKKPKRAIKLDIIELDKYETHHKEVVLLEDGLWRYLYQLVEEQGDKKNELMTISKVKTYRG